MTKGLALLTLFFPQSLPPWQRTRADLRRPTPIYPWPLLSVIYLGRHYLAFRDALRIQDMTRHFDWLVREAEVSDRDVSAHIASLLGKLR